MYGCLAEHMGSVCGRAAAEAGWEDPRRGISSFAQSAASRAGDPQQRSLRRTGSLTDSLASLQMASSRLPAALQATEEDISLLLSAQAHIGSVPSSHSQPDAPADLRHAPQHQEC